MKNWRKMYFIVLAIFVAFVFGIWCLLDNFGKSIMLIFFTVPILFGVVFFILFYFVARRDEKIERKNQMAEQEHIDRERELRSLARKEYEDVFIAEGWEEEYEEYEAEMDKKKMFEERWRLENEPDEYRK